MTGWRMLLVVAYALASRWVRLGIVRALGPPCVLIAPEGRMYLLPTLKFSLRP